MKMRIHMLALSACTLLTLNAAAQATPADNAAPFGAKKGSLGNGNPYVDGTITDIDTLAGTIAVSPANGGETLMVAIAPGTALLGHQAITAASIALGDRLEVCGIPLALQVSSMRDNQLPMPPSANGSSSDMDVPGSLRAAGVVTALMPPTITIDSSFSLTLALTAATTFAEMRPLRAAQLATGQLVRIQLAKTGDGTLTAAQVHVNLPTSS